MRHLTFLVLTLISFSANAQHTGVHTQTSDSATRNPDLNMRIRHKMSPLTITGIVLASTGPVVSGIGLAVTIKHALDPSGNGDRGAIAGLVVLGTGLSMVIAGVVMCVVGGKRDHNESHVTSFKIIAPRNNEIGIAYTLGNRK